MKFMITMTRKTPPQENIESKYNSSLANNSAKKGFPQENIESKYNSRLAIKQGNKIIVRYAKICIQPVSLQNLRHEEIGAEKRRKRRERIRNQHQQSQRNHPEGKHELKCFPHPAIRHNQLVNNTTDTLRAMVGVLLELPA